jgi:hypothetical protein
MGNAIGKPNEGSVPPARREKKDLTRVASWLSAQRDNLEGERRDAARHITSRWNVTDPWFSFSRTLRTLQREDSPYLRGAQALADDYCTQFGEDVLPEMGSLGPFLPYETVSCEKCRREAVPGSTLCGRHGGQFLSASDAKAISAHTAGRIMGATDQAVRVLQELMDEGKSEMVRLQASMALLDRAGIGPHSTISIDSGTAAEDAAAEIRDMLTRIRETHERVGEIEQMQAEPAPADASDVAVAEVVEEP